MLRYIVLIILLIFPFYSYSSDNLLTVQQQIERLQREVSDLSQIIFSSQSNLVNNNNSSDTVKNLSAIDIRIYDLEKDVKSLTGGVEEIYFQLEDLLSKINNFETALLSIEDKINSIKENKLEENLNIDSNLKTEKVENTLGSLKITDEINTNEDKKENNNTVSQVAKAELSPEDQFQIAFDNIRNKKWDEAKKLLIDFIDNNPENQLSGSAHYWLGELYILDNRNRDAALIFAEGFQKFPKSIKAPDMLFKLSQTLYEVEKIDEACKTLEKLVLDYPKNKHIKNAKKYISNFGCLDAIE